MHDNMTRSEIDNEEVMSYSLIVGIVYMIFPGFLLCAYMTFNVILQTNSELRKLQAFRLMFYMGILDCIQLVCHFFGGVLTIWPTIDVRLPFLNTIFGATINSAWVALFPLSFVTSLNRLYIIRKLTQPSSKFPPLVRVGIILSFGYCVVFWICLITFARVLYEPKSWAWAYTNSSESTILSKIEFLVSVPFIALTFCVYIAIALTIYKMTRGVKTMQKSELLFLIHAAILFIVLTSLITLWHYYDKLFSESIWLVFAINLYWMLYCGLNPLLYLIFSRKIRHAFLMLIRIVPPKPTTTVVRLSTQ